MKRDNVKFPRSLDQIYIDRAIKKDWKKYGIPKKWRGTKREKSILNLRQYSSKSHTVEAKRSSLLNLHSKSMTQQKEISLEEGFALANELIEKIGLPGELKKEEIINRFLMNIGEVHNLNKQEQLFYTRQFLHYLADYSDLNNSSDVDNLHNLILERVLIKHYRTRAKNASDPRTKEKFEKMLKQSFTRLQKYESNLFTRRRDRMGVSGKGKSFRDLAKKKDISQLEKEKEKQTKDIDDWLEGMRIKKKHV